jgi:hypothetical protein
MDELQLDTAKSYETHIASKHQNWPHPLHLMCVEEVALSPSDPGIPTDDRIPLLEVKYTPIIKTNGTWSEAWESAKTGICAVGGWVGAISKKLYKVQRDRMTRDTSASNRRTIDPEDSLSEMDHRPKKPEYLMLGLKAKSGSDYLVQVRLADTIATDTQFFHILKEEYSRNRIRYYGIPNFFKCIEGIHFVRFQTQEPGPDPHQQSIRIVDSFSLPNQGQPGWTRLVMPDRPPMPETMARYLKNPMADGLSRANRNYLQVPRKLDHEIPAQFGMIGWGLYYRECYRWLAIMISITLLHIFVLAITLSALFAN